MTTLVTGAGGFVGRHICDALRRRGEAVVAHDLARPAPLADKPGLAPFAAVSGDIRDSEAMVAGIARHGIDRIVHAAAVTAGPEREKADAATIVAVNVAATAALATSAARAGIVRFVYVGSVAVFGTQVADGEIIDEDRPHAPVPLYAVTKSAAERIVARLGDLFGLDTVVGRLGVVFGPGEIETGARDTMSPFFHALRHARAGRPIVLPRPGRRNWHFVTDAARSLATLALAPACRARVYNLGPEAVWTVQAWCDRIAPHFPGFGCSIGDVPGAPVGMHNPRDGGLLSWQRFRDEFGPTALETMDSSIERMLAAEA